MKAFEEIYRNEIFIIKTTFSFTVTMVFFNHIMAITLPATILLQKDTVDVLQNMKLVNPLTCLCSNMQHNIGDYH